MRSWYYILIILCAFGWPAFADSIFIWTDAQGVKHYSDQAPPDDVESYEEMSAGTGSFDSGAKEAYDRMIQQVQSENQQADQERQREDVQKREDQRKREMVMKQARIQAARDQLQRKIAALKRRALSPTFSQGMRQAQIDAIMKELQKLEDTAEKQ